MWGLPAQPQALTRQLWRHHAGHAHIVSELRLLPLHRPALLIQFFYDLAAWGWCILLVFTTWSTAKKTWKELGHLVTCGGWLSTINRLIWKKQILLPGSDKMHRALFPSLLDNFKTSSKKSLKNLHPFLKIFSRLQTPAVFLNSYPWRHWPTYYFTYNSLFWPYSWPLGCPGWQRTWWRSCQGPVAPSDPSPTPARSSPLSPSSHLSSPPGRWSKLWIIS